MIDAYNFVLFLVDRDYYRVAFNDLNGKENIRIVWSFYPKTRIGKYLFLLHHSKKLNKIFKLPFSSLWNKTYFKDNFADKSKPYVFFFSARWMHYTFMREYVAWLKEHYEGCKTVCYYMDKIVTWTEESKPDAIAHLFDLIITYDKNDAKDWGIEYHPTVYSPFPIEEDDKIDNCDVYFLGLAKERLQKIISIYDFLEKNGLRCDFYIAGVQDNNRISRNNVHYIKRMSYIDNLKHLSKARCILEIMQKDAVGETLRTWEAITNGKMLITDNISLKESVFYNEDFVTLIEDEGNMNINAILLYECRENSLKKMISPFRILEFVAKKQSNEIG